MKTKPQYLFIALALSARLHQAAAQGTEFTYQGRLTSGTNAANGSYDMEFSVFDSLAFGNLVGNTNRHYGTAVSNGLFTVVLDFGQNVFTGNARWLGITVRTNDGGAFTPLTPLQPLTPTPYAIMAGNAANLGGQTSTAFVARAGDTMTGTLQVSRSGSGVGLFVGNRTPFGQALFETDLSAPATHAYFAENGNRVFSVLGGGVGYFKGSLGVDGDANFAGNSSFGGDVSVGSNLSTAGSFYLGSDIFGSSGEVHIYGQRVFPAFAPERFSIDAAGYVTIKSNLLFGAQTRQMLNLWSTSYGIGVQSSAFYQRTANEFFWYKGGTHSDTFGDAGGGTQLMRLGNSGDLIVTRSASVCSLTIRGGCDVAEPFQMSTREIPKGAVVVIDDENAGQLKLSDRAYDSRVAGIVSGANGINSGISLHQEGVLEGGQNVALSGRVYVLADASSSPIKPGDLLTTSSIAGHAMKSTDHVKAQGATLGKAMSSLKEGKGLVLVLVSLQ